MHCQDTGETELVDRCTHLQSCEVGANQRPKLGYEVLQLNPFRALLLHLLRNSTRSGSIGGCLV